MLKYEGSWLILSVLPGLGLVAVTFTSSPESFSSLLSRPLAFTFYFLGAQALLIVCSPQGNLETEMGAGMGGMPFPQPGIRLS